MKNALKHIIIFFRLKTFNSKFLTRVIDFFIINTLKTYLTVKHNNISLRFYLPNLINYKRILSFSTKEPETLDWIDDFEQNKVFWDIGSNIGLYSIYSTKVNDTLKCYSFEPMFYNIETLINNITINKLEDRVVVCPFPLNNYSKSSQINYKHSQWGSSQANFDSNIDQNGIEYFNHNNFTTLGFSGDDIIQISNIEFPNYIKLDVDGIEILILSGMNLILEKVEEILLEVNTDMILQHKKTSKILNEKGLFLHKICKKGFGPNNHMCNEIYKRNL